MRRLQTSRLTRVTLAVATVGAFAVLAGCTRSSPRQNVFAPHRSLLEAADRYEALGEHALDKVSFWVDNYID